MIKSEKCLCFAGNKDFMFGSDPCELDCVAFGMLAVCKWHMFNSPHQKWLQGENIAAKNDKL